MTMNDNKIVFLAFTEKHLHEAYQKPFSASLDEFQPKILWQSLTSKKTWKNSNISYQDQDIKKVR